MDKAKMLALTETAKQGNLGDRKSLLAVSADHLERIAPELTEDEL